MYYPENRRIHEIGGDDMTTAQVTAFDFVKKLGEELTHREFDLPPFPDTAIRVRDALNDYDVTLDKITRIVLAEPVLTTRLLRMANSAMLRRGSMEITDLRTAIGRVGLEMVRNAATSMAMDNTFKAPGGSSLRALVDKTRKHSTQVCALAYVLAKREPDTGNPDQAMLAGLLHDIGKFYILTRVDDHPELFEEQEALADLLQQWHPGIGRAIVEAWGFPEQIAEAVYEHETLDRELSGPADIVDIVIVANLLAHLGDPDYPEQPDLEQIPSCVRMQLDGETIKTILEESAEEIRSLSQALNG